MLEHNNALPEQSPPSNSPDAASFYASVIGWQVFPAPPGEKKSHKSAEFSSGRRWGATADLGEINRDFKRWPEACVGIPTGQVNKFFVVEVDTVEGHSVDGLSALRELEAKHTPLPDTLRAVSPSGSVHRYFKHPGGDIQIKNSTSEIAPGVDVKGDGGMVLAPPSIRPGKGSYQWQNWGAPIADAPQWLLDLVIKKDEPHTSSGSGSNYPPADKDKLIAAVAVVPNNDLPYGDWCSIAMSIFDGASGSDSGLELFKLFSGKSAKNDDAGTEKKWRELYSSPPTDITIGTLFFKADEAMPNWRTLIGLPFDQAVKVVHLAGLSSIEYEKRRKAAAKDLGMSRVSVLDDIIKKLRPPAADVKDAQGNRISFEPTEPWADPVDGVELIRGMVSAIRKHVVLAEHQALTVALWIIHVHAIEAAEHTPRLQFRSPTHRCGKTTLMRVIAPMLPKAIGTENITIASLFRLIEMYQPTLMIDEADSFLKRSDGSDNEELRGIMNAGHSRGGCVIRTVGDDHEPRAFNVFGPICYAWMVRKGRQVARTLEDRSITIELHRRTPDEEVERLRRNHTQHLKNLGRQAARWTADHKELLVDADPSLPEELNDREQDNWRLPVAIADAVSPEVGEEARDAAKKIAIETLAGEDDFSIMALEDAAAVVKERKKDAEGVKGGAISSADLVYAMTDLVERPWATWKRGEKVMDQRNLAQLLKPFGIKPRVLRFVASIGAGAGLTPPVSPKARGYEAAPIEEAWQRFADEEGES